MTIIKASLRAASMAAATLALVAVAAAADRVETPAQSETSSGRELVAARPHANQLARPDASNAVAQRAPALTPGGVNDRQAAAAPRAYGTFGIPYTSRRVSTLGVIGAQSVGGNFLSRTYPYRAIGRLTFNVGTAGSFCSATVIRKGVIVTAAHCVSSFGSPTLYTNFKFTPANYSVAGAAASVSTPYGVWNAGPLVRPVTWTNGTDTGAGAARNNDVAVFIIQKNAQNQFIGDVVGTIGYGWNNPSFVSSPKTGNLSTAAISTLGYPGLLDGGNIMQRSDGPTYLTTVGGALQYWQGSNFTGGSSGGPWITNFGAQYPVYAGGTNSGTAPQMYVVGVTSWGSSDPNVPKDNYSSRFGQNAQYPGNNYGGRGAGNIGSLLHTLCSAIAPGTGQTWAALGYCS